MNKISMKENYKTTLIFNNDMDQYKQIHKLDKSYVGTNNYMGLAYFWDHEVKHWLRDATPFQRVKVHKLFIANKIPFDNEYKYFVSNKLAEKICMKIFDELGNTTNTMELTPQKAKLILKILKEKRGE